MTQSTDIDRILDRWMDDGPTVVADRVIAAALTEVPTTRQRGARWAPLRELFMTMKAVTIAAGVAAALLVAIAAFQILVGADVGSQGPRPAPDLAEIVVTNQNAPEGWTVDATLRGREALAPLIHYGQLADATGGFVDGRSTEFCAEAQECGTSWVALYRSNADADAAFSFFHVEMQSGWGMGTDAEALQFGEDDGYAYNNNMGAPHRQAYVWRKGNLVLGVLGAAELADALRSIADDMNARSR